ncbi:MAG: abortive infection family protein [Selenomonadaceae bacterium]|nr:abortive infection family protein [Selenomonadaceae bacterium]
MTARSPNQRHCWKKFSNTLSNKRERLRRKKQIYTNVLLSGLSSIVDSVAEMRNGNSDAHGLGKERTYDLKDYHARLVVNASMTLADFILSVAQNNLSQK